MIVKDTRNPTIASEDGYYAMGCDCLEYTLHQLKKLLKMNGYNQKKIAQLYFFYTSQRFRILSGGICDWKEHLERRGISMNDIIKIETIADLYKCRKANVRNGWVVRLKPTDSFYIKIGEYICPISTKYSMRMRNLSTAFGNGYCTGLFNKDGVMIWQTRDDSMKNYTSQIIYAQVKNGMIFVISNLEGDLVYTKQGMFVYDVDIKQKILWETILDEDIDGIWKCGERWDMDGKD